MKQVKKLVFIALFLAIGTVLDAVVPGFFFGMKPDLLLSTMFLTIFLFADRRNIAVIGLAAGLLSGLTSTIPGGFLPNVIDKLITSAVIFALFLAIRKLLPLMVNAVILTAAGTILSGTVFLTALQLCASLPPGTGFLAMFTAVVLPAAVINAVFIAIVFPIVYKIINHTPSSTKAFRTDVSSRRG